MKYFAISTARYSRTDRSIARPFGRGNCTAILWLVVANLAGVWAAAPGTARAAAADNSGDDWRIDAARPARLQPPSRVALCDFAKLAAEQQALPMPDDPVFRAPTPEAKAQLGRTRKAILTADPTGDAQLQALVGGPEGPTLARLALQDRDTRMQVAAAKAAVALAQAHPRLFAFLPTLDRNTPGNLAIALVKLDFATGCDTPILYALDALDHPSAEVVELAVRLTAAQAQQIRSPAPIDRVAAWLERRSGPAKQRLLAVRLLADLGLVHLSGLMARLSKDLDPAVAGEARVGWAHVAPADAGKNAASWWEDRRPCAQLATLRAVAILGAADPALYAAAVQAATRNSTTCGDPLTGRPRQVGEVAQQVLVYWQRGL